MGGHISKTYPNMKSPHQPKKVVQSHMKMDVEEGMVIVEEEEEMVMEEDLFGLNGMQ